MSSPALSALDLTPVPAGTSGPDALRNTLDLAGLADRLGYTRYWLAEHHNLPSVASSAPEVLIGHVASATRRIRVGAGGIMLPNHAPLKVAETFRVLEALHPGRIDLGLGRAPGTDQVTAYALRRGLGAQQGGDAFPGLLGELLAFGGEGFPDDHPFTTVQAVPIDVALPPLWILGSSDYGGKAAAAVGTGFAFAAHINPAGAVDALRDYRERFTPARPGDMPRAILAIGVLVAETDERAEWLAASLRLSYLRLRQGRPVALPSPEEALAEPLTPAERARIEAPSEGQVVGSPATVRARLDELLEASGADEVMAMTTVYDHAARRRSYELLAEAYQLAPAEAPVAA